MMENLFSYSVNSKIKIIKLANSAGGSGEITGYDHMKEVYKIFSNLLQY